MLSGKRRIITLKTVEFFGEHALHLRGEMHFVAKHPFADVVAQHLDARVRSCVPTAVEILESVGEVIVDDLRYERITVEETNVRRGELIVELKGQHSIVIEIKISSRLRLGFASQARIAIVRRFVNQDQMLSSESIQDIQRVEQTLSGVRCRQGFVEEVIVRSRPDHVESSIEVDRLISHRLDVLIDLLSNAGGFHLTTNVIVQQEIWTSTHRSLGEVTVRSGTAAGEIHQGSIEKSSLGQHFVPKETVGETTISIEWRNVWPSSTRHSIRCTGIRRGIAEGHHRCVLPYTST